MNAANRFMAGWKSGYDHRTYLSAAGSLMATLVFAFYNGFLGIRHASHWHGAMCVYYVVLTLLRGSIIAAAKRASRHKAQAAARDRASLANSFPLLILNISLIVPLSMMVRQQKPVSLTLIPAIAMAAYTTYKIVVASIALKRRRATSDSLVWLLRTIGFIDALVSILTLQNTLIMVKSGGEDPAMLPLTALTSALVWVGVLLLSLNAIGKGLRRVKKG